MKKKTRGFSNSRKTKVEYAGIHLILEFWGAKNLNSVRIIERALTETVSECRARLLKIDLHKFSPQGVSGVAIIAESHISIHTWPEHKYAAFDVFMCSGKDPYQAIDVLKEYFNPKKVDIVEIKRGIRL